MPADVEAIRAVCDPRGIPILEDAACAAGSTYRGRPVGAGSPMAAWSFHPRKLITTGEGGMLTLDDGELAERARRLRAHGMSVSAEARHASAQPVIEQYLEIGFNYRMTDVQAAIGRVQLGRLDDIVARRREIAGWYQEDLADVACLWVLQDPPYGRTNYQSLWVMLDGDSPVGRNEVLQLLADAGVSARRGIMASHLEPAYRGHPHGPLPVTEAITERSLILPVFHDLEREQVRHVSSVLAAAAR